MLVLVSFQVSLRSRSEIVQVKGTVDILNGVEVVTSLTFITNKAVYGPFGSNFGKGFETTRNTKVVGFFGRADSLLHQIGVISELNSSHDEFNSNGAVGGSFEAHHHAQENTQSDTILLSGYEETSYSTVIDNVEEQTTSVRVNGHEKTNGNSATGVLIGEALNSGIHNGKPGPSHHDGHGLYEDSCFRIHEHHIHKPRQQEVSHVEEGTIVHGPWGGFGGDLFCDGRGDIVEIQVAYNTERVISLQASYAHGSTTFKGPSHGGRGDSTAQVKLT